jgi:hypothetical protein
LEVSKITPSTIIVIRIPGLTYLQELILELTDEREESHPLCSHGEHISLHDTILAEYEDHAAPVLIHNHQDCKVLITVECKTTSTQWLVRVFLMLLPQLIDVMDTSFDALWHKVLGLSCTLPWLPLPTYGGQFLQRYAVMSLLLPLAEILDICAGQRVGRPWWLCNKPSTPRGEIAEMIGNGPLSGPKVVYFF